jgi:hypothetical protein
MNLFWNEEFSKSLEKKRRINTTGENVHLLPDGSIQREEDAIIAAQRIWRERAYAPPGTIFEKRGYFYRKIEKSFSEKSI